MALYKSEVHLASLQSWPGEIVDIDPADLDRYEGEIEAGFLTPHNEWGSWEPSQALGTPEPEMLSTVGQPQPADAE